MCKQKARPKSDQEENELIVSCLRRHYEDKQKTHTHTHDGETKKVGFILEADVIGQYACICLYQILTFLLIRSQVKSPRSRCRDGVNVKTRCKDGLCVCVCFRLLRRVR